MESLSSELPEDALADEPIEEIEVSMDVVAEENPELEKLDVDFEALEAVEENPTVANVVGAADEKDPLLAFKVLCKVVHRRNRQDLDTAWAIIGGEGTGKTQFALQAGRFLDKNFTCERNVLAFPSVKAIKELAATLPRYSPIVLDEAIKTFYKRNAMTTGNKKLNQFFMMCRKLNFIWILCIPRFLDLDPYYRESRVAIVSGIPSVQDTGVAVCFDRDENLFGASGWYWKEAYEMVRYTATKRIQRLGRLRQEHRLGLYRNTPNYLCTVRYPFDKELKKEYDAFLRKHQPAGLFGEEFEVNSKEDNIMVLRVEKAIMLMAAKGISREEIASCLEMPVKQVMVALKEKGISTEDMTLARLRQQAEQGILYGNLPVARKSDEVVEEKAVEKPKWVGKEDDSLFDI